MLRFIKGQGQNVNVPWNTMSGIPSESPT